MVRIPLEKGWSGKNSFGKRGSGQNSLGRRWEWLGFFREKEGVVGFS